MPQETSPREAPWVSSQAVGRSSRHSTEVAGVSAGVNSRGVVQSCADIVQQKLTNATRAVETRSSCLSIMRVLGVQNRSISFLFCPILLFIRRIAYNLLPHVQLTSAGPYNPYLFRHRFTCFRILYSLLSFITSPNPVTKRLTIGLNSPLTCPASLATVFQASFPFGWPSPKPIKKGHPCGRPFPLIKR